MARTNRQVTRRERGRKARFGKFVGGIACALGVFLPTMVYASAQESTSQNGAEPDGTVSVTVEQKVRQSGESQFYMAKDGWGFRAVGAGDAVSGSTDEQGQTTLQVPISSEGTVDLYPAYENAPLQDPQSAIVLDAEGNVVNAECRVNDGDRLLITDERSQNLDDDQFGYQVSELSAGDSLDCTFFTDVAELPEEYRAQTSAPSVETADLKTEEAPESDSWANPSVSEGPLSPVEAAATGDTSRANDDWWLGFKLYKTLRYLDDSGRETNDTLEPNGWPFRVEVSNSSRTEKCQTSNGMCAGGMWLPSNQNATTYVTEDNLYDPDGNKWLPKPDMWDGQRSCPYASTPGQSNGGLDEAWVEKECRGLGFTERRYFSNGTVGWKAPSGWQNWFVADCTGTWSESQYEPERTYWDPEDRHFSMSQNLPFSTTTSGRLNNNYNALHDGTVNGVYHVVTGPKGEIVCKFENRRPYTKLNIEKRVYNSLTGKTEAPKQEWTFDPIRGTSSSDRYAKTTVDGKTQFDVMWGNVQIQEQLRDDYQLKNWSCSKKHNGVTTTVANGTSTTIDVNVISDDVTCVVTNQPPTKKLTVRKYVKDYDGSTLSNSECSNFRFNVSTNDGYNKSSYANGNNCQATFDIPGATTFNLSEDQVSGWQIANGMDGSAFRCYYDNTGRQLNNSGNGYSTTVYADYSDDITCEVTNIKDEVKDTRFTLRKMYKEEGAYNYEPYKGMQFVAMDPSGRQEINERTDYDGYVTQTITNPKPGQWTISEHGDPDTQKFDSISCNVGTGSGSTQWSDTLHAATVNVEPGKDITCTFYNSERPKPKVSSFQFNKTWIIDGKNYGSNPPSGYSGYVELGTTSKYGTTANFGQTISASQIKSPFFLNDGMYIREQFTLPKGCELVKEGDIMVDAPTYPNYNTSGWAQGGYWDRFTEGHNVFNMKNTIECVPETGSVTVKKTWLDENGTEITGGKVDVSIGTKPGSISNNGSALFEDVPVGSADVNETNIVAPPGYTYQQGSTTITADGYTYSGTNGKVTVKDGQTSHVTITNRAVKNAPDKINVSVVKKWKITGNHPTYKPGTWNYNDSVGSLLGGQGRLAAGTNPSFTNVNWGGSISVDKGSRVNVGENVNLPAGCSWASSKPVTVTSTIDSQTLTMDATQHAYWDKVNNDATFTITNAIDCKAAVTTADWTIKKEWRVEGTNQLIDGGKVDLHVKRTNPASGYDQTKTISNNGQAGFDSMPAGTYTVEEKNIQAPSGYTFTKVQWGNNTPGTNTVATSDFVAGDSKTLVVTNWVTKNAATGKFTITKNWFEQGTTNKLPNDGKTVIQISKNGTVVAKKDPVSGSTSFSFDGLEDGTYLLEELLDKTQAPSGYEFISGDTTFNGAKMNRGNIEIKNGETKNVTINNYAKSTYVAPVPACPPSGGTTWIASQSQQTVGGNVTITAKIVDAKGNPIQGVEVMYNSTGDQPGDAQRKGTTDANGNVSWTVSQTSKTGKFEYVLRIIGGTGYPGTSYNCATLYIDWVAAPVVPGEGTLKVTKKWVDEQGVQLSSTPNAKVNITVKSADGKYEQSATINNNGEATFTKVPEGTATVTETSYTVPDGYEYVSTKVNSTNGMTGTVQVNKNSTVTVPVENKVKLKTVTPPPAQNVKVTVNKKWMNENYTLYSPIGSASVKVWLGGAWPQGNGSKVETIGGNNSASWTNPTLDSEGNLHIAEQYTLPNSNVEFVKAEWMFNGAVVGTGTEFTLAKKDIPSNGEVVIDVRNIVKNKATGSCSSVSLTPSRTSLPVGETSTLNIKVTDGKLASGTKIVTNKTNGLDTSGTWSGNTWALPSALVGANNAGASTKYSVAGKVDFTATVVLDNGLSCPLSTSVTWTEAPPVQDLKVTVNKKWMNENYGLYSPIGNASVKVWLGGGWPQGNGSKVETIGGNNSASWTNPTLDSEGNLHIAEQYTLPNSNVEFVKAELMLNGAIIATSTGVQPEFTVTKDKLPTSGDLVLDIRNIVKEKPAQNTGKFQITKNWYKQGTTTKIPGGTATVKISKGTWSDTKTITGSNTITFEGLENGTYTVEEILSGTSASGDYEFVPGDTTIEGVKKTSGSYTITNGGTTSLTINNYAKQYDPAPVCPPNGGTTWIASQYEQTINGQVKLTAKIVDAKGNPVQGVEVMYNSSGDQPGDSQRKGTTDANGNVSWTVSQTSKTGKYTYTLRIIGGTGYPGTSYNCDVLEINWIDTPAITVNKVWNVTGTSKTYPKGTYSTTTNKTLYDKLNSATNAKARVGFTNLTETSTAWPSNTATYDWGTPIQIKNGQGNKYRGHIGESIGSLPNGCKWVADGNGYTSFITHLQSTSSSGFNAPANGSRIWSDHTAPNTYTITNNIECEDVPEPPVDTLDCDRSAFRADPTSTDVNRASELWAQPRGAGLVAVSADVKIEAVNGYTGLSWQTPQLGKDDFKVNVSSSIAQTKQFKATMTQGSTVCTKTVNVTWKAKPTVTVTKEWLVDGKVLTSAANTNAKVEVVVPEDGNKTYTFGVGGTNNFGETIEVPSGAKLKVKEVSATIPSGYTGDYQLGQVTIDGQKVDMGESTTVTVSANKSIKVSNALTPKPVDPVTVKVSKTWVDEKGKTIANNDGEVKVTLNDGSAHPVTIKGNQTVSVSGITPGEVTVTESDIKAPDGYVHTGTTINGTNGNSIKVTIPKTGTTTIEIKNTVKDAPFSGKCFVDVAKTTVVPVGGKTTVKAQFKDEKGNLLSGVVASLIPAKGDSPTYGDPDYLWAGFESTGPNGDVYWSAEHDKAGTYQFTVKGQINGITCEGPGSVTFATFEQGKLHVVKYWNINGGQVVLSHDQAKEQGFSAKFKIMPAPSGGASSVEYDFDAYVDSLMGASYQISEPENEIKWNGGSLKDAGCKLTARRLTSVDGMAPSYNGNNTSDHLETGFAAFNTLRWPDLRPNEVVITNYLVCPQIQMNVDWKFQDEEGNLIDLGKNNREETASGRDEVFNQFWTSDPSIGHAMGKSDQKAWGALAAARAVDTAQWGKTYSADGAKQLYLKDKMVDLDVANTQGLIDENGNASDCKIESSKLVTRNGVAIEEHDYLDGDVYRTPVQADASLSDTKKRIDVFNVVNVISCPTPPSEEAGTVQWQKVDAGYPDILIGGSKWQILGISNPDFVLDVEDCMEDGQCEGTYDEDSSLGGFKVTLPAGNYKLVETEAPLGYEKSNTEYEFTVVGGQATTIETDLGDGKIPNSRIDVSVSLPMTGEKGMVLLLITGGITLALAAWVMRRGGSDTITI